MNLDDVMLAFRTGKYANLIKHVRSVLSSEGPDAYRDAKKSLPAIAFCGEFQGGHGKSNLIRFNNLLVFDIDHLSEEEMIRVRECLSKDKVVKAFWASPSGNGYKGLIKVEFNNVAEGITLDLLYKKAFADIVSYFKGQHGIQLDEACSDYSRICYACWDEGLICKEESIPFVVNCGSLLGCEEKRGGPTHHQEHGGETRTLKEFKPVNVKGKNSPRDRAIISSITKYLTKRNLSITSTYDEWLRVGFAIAGTFNYDLGLKYYLDLCKLDGAKYDEAKSIEKLQECYMKGTGEISLGTIIEMARQKGYVFKGSSEDS